VRLARPRAAAPGLMPKLRRKTPPPRYQRSLRLSAASAARSSESRVRAHDQHAEEVLVVHHVEERKRA
jgi:hypothetical protein